MRGAHSLVAASAAAGIDTCFANPGTSELAIVDALRDSSIRAVPVLFEGVAAAAADGYARVAGKPACTLLHLGIGYANAISHFHGARRGTSPIVVWVGDVPADLLASDPPGALRVSVDTTAGLVSTWVRRARSADTIDEDARAAVSAACRRPRGIATLIVPTDVSHAEVSPDAEATPPERPSSVGGLTVDAVARRITSARRPMFLLGGQPLTERDLTNVAALAAKTSGSVLVEYRPHRIRVGRGVPLPAQLAQQDMRKAREQLDGHDLLVLVGAEYPAPYFAFAQGGAALVSSEVSVLELGGSREDPLEVLAAVCGELAAKPTGHIRHHGRMITTGDQEPTTAAIETCAAIASVVPPDAIVINQGITASRTLFGVLEMAPPHDYLACGGGALGFGLGAAVGAAIAAPERRVIAISGDGTAAYTLQALWTHAREGLDITTVILVNNNYNSLREQLDTLGLPVAGTSDALTDIARPAIDWTLLAKGFGVPATRVDTTSALRTALLQSFATPGPHLIAMMLAN